MSGGRWVSAAARTAAGDLDRVGPSDQDLFRTRIEPARQQNVVDDPREPLRLAGDHVEHPLLLVDAERDVVAPQRHRRAVDRGERSAKLVRDRRDEVALQLLDGPLLGEIPERVHRALRELGGGEREPELPAGPLERERLLPLGRLLERPRAEHVRRARPRDHALRETRDALGRRIPEPDDAVPVDEEDTVADELECLRRLGSALQLADEARVVHRHSGPPGQLLRQIEVGLLEAVAPGVSPASGCRATAPERRSERTSASGCRSARSASGRRQGARAPRSTPVRPC